MKQKPRPPGTRQVLVGFDFDRTCVRPATTQTSLVEVAHRPFLPLGLLLWGTTSDTFVQRVSVRNLCELSLSSTRLPARYFESGRSMAEVIALADRGELELTLAERQVLEMEVAEVGNQLLVQLEGPFSDACLWGLTYTSSGPTKTATIVYQPRGSKKGDGTERDREGYEGSVIAHRLGGDVVTSSVWAPSEASAVALLGLVAPAYRC